MYMTTMILVHILRLSVSLSVTYPIPVHSVSDATVTQSVTVMNEIERDMNLMKL